MPQTATIGAMVSKFAWSCVNRSINGCIVGSFLYDSCTATTEEHMSLAGLTSLRPLQSQSAHRRWSGSISHARQVAHAASASAAPVALVGGAAPLDRASLAGRSWREASHP